MAGYEGHGSRLRVKFDAPDMLEETLTLATTIGAATAMGDRLEEMLPQLKKNTI